MPNSRSMNLVDDLHNSEPEPMPKRKRSSDRVLNCDRLTHESDKVDNYRQINNAGVDDDEEVENASEQTSLFGNRTAQMRARGLALENRAPAAAAAGQQQHQLQRRRRAAYRSRSQSPHNYLESNDNDGVRNYNNGSSLKSSGGGTGRRLVRERLPEKRGEEGASVRFLGIDDDDDDEDEENPSSGETAESDEGLSDGNILLRRYNKNNNNNSNSNSNSNSAENDKQSDDDATMTSTTDESFSSASSSSRTASSDDDENNSLEISRVSSDVSGSGNGSSNGRSSLRVSFSQNNDLQTLAQSPLQQRRLQQQRPSSLKSNNNNNGSLRKYQSLSVQHSTPGSPSYTVIDLTDRSDNSPSTSTPTREQSALYNSNSKTITCV